LKPSAKSPRGKHEKRESRSNISRRSKRKFTGGRRFKKLQEKEFCEKFGSAQGPFLTQKKGLTNRAKEGKIEEKKDFPGS